MDILIKNVVAVDADTKKRCDVYIKNGKIENIDDNISENCKVIDGEGLTLMPAFVDLHCHFRDPGYTYKEDISSGSHAAVKGGYTAVNLMANTNPVCSSMETVEYVREKARKENLVYVNQAVSITENFDGTTLDHLYKLDDSVKLISDDGRGVLKNSVMLNAMRIAVERNLTILSHCEDSELTKQNPDMRDSENVETIRNVGLARYTGARLHLCHVSTIEAMSEIIDAKKKGYPITCEVTPHHIGLNDNTKYRVNPPLRAEKDVEFLIQAIKDGYVDAIATDHAPHTPEDKLKGAPGMTGLESAFSVCYTKLVKENGISMQKLSEIMSRNPAKIMGVNKGILSQGYDGDVVLVNTDKKVVIDASKFASKGKNTPFDNMEFYGEIACTIKGGEIVYTNEGYKL